MSSPWTIIIGILVIGVFFVLVPVVVEALLRFRIRRNVTCPETGQTAEVDLDVARAAAGSAFGRLALRVKSCSFWPAQAGCAQRCLDTEKLDAEHTTRE